MKILPFTLPFVVVVAVAGWARAGDPQDLTERLKAIEDRLAAVEHGTTLPADGIVRVRGLVVQDSKGRDRVVIGAQDHRIAGLTIIDADGTKRVSLGLEEYSSGPSLRFTGPEGKERLTLVSDERRTAISLVDGPDRQHHLLFDAPIDGAVGLGPWGPASRTSSPTRDTGSGRTAPSRGAAASRPRGRPGSS